MLQQTNKAKGYAAESAAADWLAARGYRIIERNATFPGAEIDFVCAKDGFTVFLELKWRAGPLFGAPEEALTWTKRRALARAIAVWCVRHGADLDDARFDFLAGERLPNGTTEWRLYENVELG